MTNVRDTYYCIGTVAGPHPYPAMVRDFQCVIGEETRAQMLELEGAIRGSCRIYLVAYCWMLCHRRNTDAVVAMASF